MKVKMNTAIQMKNLSSSIIDKKMPVKTSYKFMRLLKAIETEAETFFNAKMKDIIMEYGRKDENGQLVFLENGNVEIEPGKETECNKKIRELEEIEVEIPDTKFSIDELEMLELSPIELYVFDSILE